MEGIDDDTADADGVDGALRLLRDAADDLDEVDAALRRIDDGSYGSCRTCGAPIGDEVLASAPTASACPRHT